MGCQFANDQTKFYSQEKNAVETFLLYEKKNEGLNHWTETCGPTSLWNGCEAMGKSLVIPGTASELIRPADMIFAYLNAPENWENLPPWNNVKPGEAPANRVQGWLPIALKSLFGVNSTIRSGLSFDDVKALVQQGHAVQLWRTVGHYVVAVDYDDSKDSLIYWDSFHLYVNQDESLTDDGTGGFRRAATRDWFAKSLHDSFIEILP
jgi:hypothetical protein